MPNNKFLMKEVKASNPKILARENKSANFIFGNWKLEIGNSRDSFTIVELLVSIGLFGIIVSIAMGGFVRALRTQKQIVALITASSNASLVIEQISREIRTGFNFCEVSCTPQSLNFKNSRGETVVYSLDTAFEGYGIITRRVNSGPQNQITADSVNIRYLNFIPLSDPPASLDPLYPPRITILVGLSPRAGQAVGVSENITNIQTTVSARNF